MPKERKPRFRVLIEATVPAEDEMDAKAKVEAICRNISVMNRYQSRVASVSPSQEETRAR